MTRVKELGPGKGEPKPSKPAKSDCIPSSPIHSDLAELEECLKVVYTATLTLKGLP